MVYAVLSSRTIAGVTERFWDTANNHEDMKHLVDTRLKWRYTVQVVEGEIMNMEDI